MIRARSIFARGAIFHDSLAGSATSFDAVGTAEENGRLQVGELQAVQVDARALIDGFELGEGWVRLAMWLTSASPGGFHDWKTLYQDRHRFYMWLHTYLDEAKLHYCKPTVPLLEIKNNAEAIYSKKQQ